MKGRTVALIALTMALLLIATHYSGLRFSRSESLPGLFWKLEKLNTAELKQLTTGDVVFFCPPDTPFLSTARQRGYWNYAMVCSGGHPPLIKPIAATRGDRVQLTAAGVRINTQRIPHSKPQQQDRAGRPLPNLTGMDIKLSSDQIWLLSTYHAYSLDSRYFGPVDLEHILGKARPLDFTGW